jgi:hypothetical protein
MAVTTSINVKRLLVSVTGIEKKYIPVMTGSNVFYDCVSDKEKKFYGSDDKHQC